jgi:nucleotide-binding universal stress UspA family protein
MKFLVAYNGSNESRSALDLATNQAKRDGAKILVVSSSEGGKSETQEEIAKITEDLQEIKKGLQEVGVNCEVEQLARGLSPGEDVILYADENHVDHIYVGIQKKSKTRKLLLGSTAQYIILKANCPVTSVK